jgi:hypothetical protein
MKKLAQLQQEQARRVMLEVLADSVTPLRAMTVRVVMDGLNASFTWDGFLGCIAYLVGEGLICVFPVTESGECTIYQQEKYLGLMRQTSYDSQEARQMMLRLRQTGRRYLEGNEPSVKGVA